MGGRRRWSVRPANTAITRAYPAAVMAALPGLPMIVRMSAALRYIMARFGI